MQRSFPGLPAFDLADPGELDRVYQAYVGLIPRLHPPALAAQERSALVKLTETTGSQALKLAAAREIAESDVRGGIIYSTWVQQCPDIWERVQPDLHRHEAGYGAPVFSRAWRSYSRGKSLAFYFANSERLVEGRRVLHVAPERELIDWFKSRASALRLRYETLNLGGDVHFVEDLTALDLPDDSFDLIICHRVLEHIFDDRAAIREAWRVLRRGGIFNVSVPESMHVPRTDMWAIPDLSHHHHYRQYGADFAAQLSDCGFDVEVAEWLLEQPSARLDEAGVYPLRMYNAHKN